MNCKKINIPTASRLKKAYYRFTHELKNIISDKNLFEWKQIPKQITDENKLAIMSMFDKEMYTYCLIDDTIIFAEFKPKNHNDWAIYDEFSKHALICGANEICVSGEFKKNDNNNFVFDINSGTYAPKQEDLVKLEKVKKYLGIISNVSGVPEETTDSRASEDLYDAYPRGDGGGKSRNKRSKSKRRKAGKKRTLRKRNRRNK